MNKQFTIINGVKVNNKIEWTDWTFNPIAGCKHNCQWTMPDGKVANCYAEDVAEGIGSPAYPMGFDHHYWKPLQLTAPLSVKEPSRIFVGSMADVFGHWVPAEQIQQVLDATQKAHWHQFQFLTKNPVRTKQFAYGDNCWIGSSTPPDYMWNTTLSQKQKIAYLHRLTASFAEVKASVKWLSAEPLSWDVAEVLKDYPHVINWIVIGAASNGRTYYQPDPKHVEKLLALMDEWKVPVFFKGNLRPSLGKAFDSWREEFPR
jgi:protein gp37